MQNEFAVYAQRALELALCVGRRASAENWVKEKLEREYAEFIREQSSSKQGRAAQQAKERREMEGEEE